MGRSQRRKGINNERHLCKRIEELSNGILYARRVPLSGAQAGYPDDVVVEYEDGGHAVNIECKVRGDGFKNLYRWIEDTGAVAVRADRKDWLVVLRVEDYVELMCRARTAGEEG